MTHTLALATLTGALAWLICSRMDRSRQRRREQKRRRRLLEQPTELQRWAAEHWHPAPIAGPRVPAASGQPHPQGRRRAESRDGGSASAAQSPDAALFQSVYWPPR